MWDPRHSTILRASITGSRDISVSTATGYGLVGPDFDSRQGLQLSVLSTESRQALAPIKHPVQLANEALSPEGIAKLTTHLRLNRMRPEDLIR
jgi:hypothetical protein